MSTAILLLTLVQLLNQKMKFTIDERKFKFLKHRWFCVPGSSGTLKDVSSNENGLFERGKIVIIKSKLKLKGGL